MHQLIMYFGVKKYSNPLKNFYLFLLGVCISNNVLGQCTPGANLNGNCAVWLTNVNIQGTTLNNNSLCSSPYIIYPGSGNTTAILNSGSSYTINLTNDGSQAALASIWLDFNGDGVFSCSHTDELIAKDLFLAEAPFGSSTGTTISYTFLVPSLATGNNIRLRVRIDHFFSTYNTGGVSDPCVPLKSGETEDYLVNIIPNGPPACSPLQIIPNPSFEGLPNSSSENLQLTGNWWNGCSNSTSDYNNGSWWNSPPTPQPNGNGTIGTYITQEYKEFFGTCLTNPFLAGVAYTFDISVAENNPNNPSAPAINCPIDLTLYGNTVCGGYPFNGGGPEGSTCPPSSNWQVLGTANYIPSNSWNTITFSFTPSVNINAILLGAPCTVPTCYPLQASGSNSFPYFYWDNIISQVNMSISPAGNLCSNNLTLTGTGINTSNVTYQWYFNGSPIAGQTSITLNVSANSLPEGNYTLLAEFGCTCAQASYMVTNSPQPIDISYSSNSYCQSTSTETPTITGTTGGTFSASPSGLIIDPVTGEIDLSSPINNYTISYITSGVCGDTASFDLSITNANSADFSYAGPYCQGGTDPSPILNSGSSAGTFTSTPAGLVFVSAVTGEVDLSASTPGTYTVTNTVTASGGCPEVSSTATITISYGNEADFSYSGPYCINDIDPTATLDPGSSAGNFTATPAGLVFVNSATGEVDLSATTPGTYTVTNTVAASGACPQVSATNTITIVPLQNASFSYPNNSYCQSVNTAVPTINGMAGGDFTVAPTGLIIDVATGEIDLSSPAGIYTITYTTPGPCENSSSQVVQITSSLFITVSSMEICEGEVATLNAVPSVSGGTYSWNPGGQGNSSVDVNPNQTTSYTVTYTLNGCSASSTGTVTVNPTPNPIISAPYTTISEGESIQLTVGSADSYLWNTGQTGQTISISPVENTTYCVEVTDNGCSNEACILIQIGCESLVYAPNCITANGDLINDEFLVQGDCLSEFNLLIFNRWGELIFESFDISESWNGTYKGKPVSDGVYTDRKSVV